MASPVTSSVVIECPHCGTRYQLPPEAIGPKGRKVACAHCGETWDAKAVAVPGRKDPDALFNEDTEAELDAAFAEAERSLATADPIEDARQRTIADIKAAIAPKPRPEAPQPPADPAADKKSQKAFSRRQAEITRKLPFAKVRRGVRVVGVTLLLALIVAGVAFRTEIVRRFPDLAGAYAALGLGVNVVGLEFRDVTTLVAPRGGTDIMQIDARIYSVASRTLDVPHVVITLLDDAGAALYQWSTAPDVRQLAPGEVADFMTQLTSPPAGATRVRLTFTDGKSHVDSPVSAAAQPSE